MTVRDQNTKHLSYQYLFCQFYYIFFIFSNRTAAVPWFDCIIPIFIFSRLYNSSCSCSCPHFTRLSGRVTAESAQLCGDNTQKRIAFMFSICKGGNAVVVGIVMCHRFRAECISQNPPSRWGSWSLGMAWFDHRTSPLPTALNGISKGFPGPKRHRIERRKTNI